MQQSYILNKLSFTERIETYILPCRIFAIVTIFLLLSSPLPASENPLPEAIAAMPRQETQTGQEAKQAIQRLHGKAFEFDEGYIGAYKGDAGEATLWISEYGVAEEASADIELMVHKIRTGSQQVFGHFLEQSIEEIPVYFVVGMGQAHYFFHYERLILWLAVEPPVAKEAITDLIEKLMARTTQQNLKE